MFYYPEIKFNKKDLAIYTAEDIEEDQEEIPVHRQAAKLLLVAEKPNSSKKDGLLKWVKKTESAVGTR